MPWTAGDVSRHKKGLRPKEKKKWSKIANAVLKQSGDEVMAIKVANSRTRKVKKEMSVIDLGILISEDLVRQTYK